VDELLVAEGWFVARIWEHEIKESLDQCLRRVAGILEQRGSV
jgi:very-short-patch-repair endonuclease